MGKPAGKKKRQSEPSKDAKQQQHRSSDSAVFMGNRLGDKKTVDNNNRTAKFILGDDIRWAHIPPACTIRHLRDIVLHRFPNLKAALIKYKDPEGDLITITTTDDLRFVESSSPSPLRLHILQVTPDKDPLFEPAPSTHFNTHNQDHLLQFACHFKNHVGFECDSYLHLHDIAIKLYSKAVEDTVTCEGLFEVAAAKFQEMAALSFFNWGTVHMSRARKRVYFSDEGSLSLLEQVKSAYEWARKEYGIAGRRYEQALSLKQDFYEALLALTQQQFELAKLSWYYLVGSKVELETGTCAEILELYNKAEDSMERGTEMWEEMEEQRLNGLSKNEQYKALLQKMGLNGLVNDKPAEEAQEQAAHMRSQVYLLWGTMLYERSVVEFKLRLPTWEECLEVAMEKFELAGASQIDIAVMIKNHCSNETALEGFKVDEIVQAWKEMYDTSRWQSAVPAFRLEPLFRRRAPSIHTVLENL